MNRARGWIVMLPLSFGPALGGHWPAWRGSLGTGLCGEKNLSSTWSSNQNVKWRVPLPEAGDSTPVVRGDRVSVAEPVGARRTLICFHRTDGRTLWEAGVNWSSAMLADGNCYSIT